MNRHRVGSGLYSRVFGVYCLNTSRHYKLEAQKRDCRSVSPSVPFSLLPAVAETSRRVA
jgi:hypothetical protein